LDPGVPPLYLERSLRNLVILALTDPLSWCQIHATESMDKIDWL